VASAATSFFKELRAKIKVDNIPVKAAGVAFFALLALVPAMFAAVSIYALVSDPDEIEESITDALSSAPEEVQAFFSSQLSSLAQGSSSGLELAALIGIVIALWSASGAIKQLMATLNEISGLEESRGFVKLRGTALLCLVGAILFLVVTMFLLGFLPGVIAALDLPAAARWSVGVLRFPLLFLVMVFSLSVLYHLGPARPVGRPFRAFSLGAVVATTVWIVLSSLLSIYTANFAHLNESLAVFGTFLILQLWLLLTVFSVLLGAEIDEVKGLRQGGSAEAETETTQAAEAAAAPAPS
jgi:membrane protein